MLKVSRDTFRKHHPAQQPRQRKQQNLQNQVKAVEMKQPLQFVLLDTRNILSIDSQVLSQAAYVQMARPIPLPIVFW